MDVSTSTAPLLAAVLLLLIFLVGTIKKAYFSPLRNIPGPWHTRFTNLKLKIAVITGKRLHYVHDLQARYGPMVRISPTEIAVNYAEAFREIHGIGSGFKKSAWYQAFADAERPNNMQRVESFVYVHSVKRF